MTKTITYCFIVFVIFWVILSRSMAQDCYFNNITFQPPNFAVCYPQQAARSTPKPSIGHRGRRVNLHARH